jgi:hypothetical protein
MRSDAIVQQHLRTPTGPFFARFFIGIIPGLVTAFAFMRPSTRLIMSSFAARWVSREQNVGWKFRHGCSTGRHALTPSLLTAQPFVSIDALAALSALLDLALKDRTPSVSLLSGASRTSHDENRGDTHVTRDGNAREQIPAQCYSAWGPDADRHDKPLIHMPLEGHASASIHRMSRSADRSERSS